MTARAEGIQIAAPRGNIRAIHQPAKHGSRAIVMVGGAVVISAGVESELVAGVATVASHTYGTDGVAQLAPKGLLLQGTADRTLPDRCSRDLYARAREPKELVLYPGDDHGFTPHRAEMLAKLRQCSVSLLGANRSEQA